MHSLSERLSVILSEELLGMFIDIGAFKFSSCRGHALRIKIYYKFINEDFYDKVRRIVSTTLIT